jgi:integrase/recombinase XerC
LSRSPAKLDTTPKDIQSFLDNLPCTNAGKHGYYRALRAYFNWLYSPKSGLKLRMEDNPILAVYAPKVERKILPSLRNEQLASLIAQADNIRDKSIISLFADSGLRLRELANIESPDINWEERLIRVVCKGNKEGWAIFSDRTESLLKEWLSTHKTSGNMWGLKYWGIANMLRRLHEKTGLKCNPHVFRRTFASNLARKGIDILHIKRLGRWESIKMVEHYTA